MSEVLRVLLVEDSPTDGKLTIQEIRRAGHAVEFERVEDPESMRARLAERTWDVILCDWSMPRFSALAALGVVRELALDLPFIIVSGTIGEDLAVEAMRAGANDYLLKGKLARLTPAIEREIREHRERKQAEAKVRGQEILFRALVEYGVDGIGLASREGAITYVSAATERIFGRTAAEMVGTLPLDYVHPDDQAQAREQVRGVVAAPGCSVSGKRRILRPDGTLRSLELTWTNLLDTPDVGAIVTNIRDVTERDAAEAALRVSEARFARLSECGILGIIIGNSDGSILEANDVFLRMVGYSREDLAAGRIRWRELTAPESQEATRRAREELGARGVATPYEKEYVRKDGSRIAVLTGLARLADARTIGFMVDLTGQKRAEEALKRSEQQLLQAQKMEAVGRLAGGVAHDFNNILSVILSYTSILNEDLPPDDPLRDPVSQIEKAGHRAAALTRQLLMFSRQEVVQPAVLDLNEVLANMEKMLQRILGEDVDLVCLGASQLGRVRADVGHIEQVIMNLAVNSRDAMPKGGKLTIETKNVVLDDTHAREHLGVEPGAYVLLAVSDTGTGMDPETQKRIFEPFFTTKERGKGTGLGLSTVFGIVQQSKGSVWVYSEPGHGSTFKVYLPRVDAQSEIAPAAAGTSSLRGHETLLLVEDEDQIRTVACKILRKQGYTVIDARSGPEALLRSEGIEGKIDLLVTDVVMPQMSGPELAQRMLRTRPETKILCMSGYTDDALVRHGALEAGMAYLQKPITPDTLLRKIRAVLDGK